jgi:flagellar M-ring protein FliF
VRSAIGFDAKRGDQVEVVNLRFAETTPAPINEPTGWMSYLQFTKDDIMRFAEQGVMAILGLVVLFFVVRPLVRRIVSDDSISGNGSVTVASAAGTMGVATAVGMPTIVGAASPAPTGTHSIVHNGGGSAPSISIVGAEEQVAISNRTAAMIDIAQVQGQVHAQSVQKVGELADQNPHEAVSIIRSWLHEEPHTR